MVKVLSSIFEQRFGTLTILETYLTTNFGIRQFKSTSAMRVIYFLKMFKIESKLRNCKKKKKNREIFLVSERMASQNVAINFLL